MNDENPMREQHRQHPEPEPPRERNDPNPAETTDAAGTPDARNRPLC